jgi:putative ABC transport system permease protein
MLLDLKAAFRELAKNRWFACVTVLTLALGIGANTAIFGVVNRLLLNTWPYPDAERLVYLRIALPRLQFATPPPALVAGAWSDQARSFEAVEGHTFRSVLAYDENGARVLTGMSITPNLPALLGVAPLHGRSFTAADAEPGAPAVVLLSYEIWQRDYGGASDTIGRALTLDELPHTIIGVLPRRWDAFAAPLRPEVWFPRSFPAASDPPAASLPVEIIGRLRPGVSLDAATAELEAILEPTLKAAPRPLYGTDVPTVRLEGPTARVAANTRDALLVLTGAVGLVLLVACSNVANLLLARSASRARELSLRTALGASSWRLVRALFAECVVLALLAGVAGVALGWATLRILVWLRPNSLSAIAEAQIDATVVAFTFGVSLATALLFGLAPALQLRSRKLGDALRHGASGVVRGGSGARLRKLLVAAQMAMSVVLLVSAGLLVRSFVHLQSVDVGFDARNLFTATLTLPRGRYQEISSREVLLEQLLDRIRSSPGVAAATQAAYGPPSFLRLTGIGFEIRGVTLSEADTAMSRGFNSVRPDYFDTLGLRLLQGRTFTTDEARNGGVMLVNQAAAKHFWPDGEALGTEVKWGRDWSTVIGVTDNVIAGGLTQQRDAPMFYMPAKQERLFPGLGPPNLTLIVRAAGDGAGATASLRNAVRELDPEIAISSILLTETALAGSIQGPRFNMVLLAAFAVIALVLAAIGLAAVIGYEVTERTHEIGIRMALGARTDNVRRLAMWHGLTPALVGVVLGVIGALVGTELAASLLHGVAPRDPLTFAGVVGLLVLVALGASWLPAQRATRVDPIVALRAE